MEIWAQEDLSFHILEREIVEDVYKINKSESAHRETWKSDKKEGGKGPLGWLLNVKRV